MLSSATKFTTGCCTAPQMPQLMRLKADIDNEKLIILVQQCLELYKRSLETYQDVTRKAAIWRAISIQILPACWINPLVSFVVDAFSFFRQRCQRCTLSAAVRGGSEGSYV